GKLDRSPGAQIHGDIQNDTPDHAEAGEASEESRESRFMRAAKSFGGSVTRMAMLFVFGAVLFALVTRRMGRLEGEVVQRPMRTLAFGVVGSIGILVVFGCLCVTVIGIPVAVVGLLAAIFGAYAGVCAVLAAVGNALLGRLTANPYLHLAAGCALFLLVGFIP